MAAADCEHAAKVFFTEFDRAFATFDGAVIAARYKAPYLAIRADGSSECFATLDAIAAYFQRIVDEYHEKGCRSCRHRDLEVAAVGADAAFASVTWELRRDDASVVVSWRESYNLVRSGEKFKACASMDHRDAVSADASDVTERAVLESPRPVLKVDSFEKAVHHYVDWLGFELDWEWREGPGAPAIAAFSRDGFEFMINEHPDTLGPTQIHLRVGNFAALVHEWNARRPGTVQPRVEPPYEFTDCPIEDPFGNIIVFEDQDVAQQTKQREAVAPKMRAYIQRELDAGRGFPTPEAVRAAVGPPLGVAIEVLNEFPAYAAVFRARRATARAADDDD